MKVKISGETIVWIGIMLFIVLTLVGCSEINPFEYSNGAQFCDVGVRDGVAYEEYGIVYCNNGEYYDGN